MFCLFADLLYSCTTYSLKKINRYFSDMKRKFDLTQFEDKAPSSNYTVSVQGYKCKTLWQVYFK